MPLAVGRAATTVDRWAWAPWVVAAVESERIAAAEPEQQQQQQQHLAVALTVGLAPQADDQLQAGVAAEGPGLGTQTVAAAASKLAAALEVFGSAALGCGRALQ